MKKRIIIFMLTAFMVLNFSAVFAMAQDDGAQAAALKASGVIAIAAALAVGMGALGTGIGAGLTAKAALDGTARNPEVSNKLTVTMVIGLAIIESLAIYALVVSLIILFAFPFAGGIRSALGM